MREIEANFMRLALLQKETIDRYQHYEQQLGFFKSLVTWEFFVALISSLMVYLLTFYGTQFERVPVCFLISMIVYSVMSRYRYFVESWGLPTKHLLLLFCVIAAIAGVAFFLLYSILKPITLVFLSYLFYDAIDDAIESWTKAIFYTWLTRICCLIAFCVTFFLMIKFYKWIKKSYEVFFCAVFAIVGGLLTCITLDDLIGVPPGFDTYVADILSQGSAHVVDFNFLTFCWLFVAVGAFVYQNRNLKHDLLGDRKEDNADTKEADEHKI